jgi:hypothetical protein
LSETYARQFTMTLPLDLDRSLTQLVSQTGASRGEIVRTALRAYINDPMRSVPRKRAAATAARPTYAPPRAAYHRPNLGDVGLLSTTLAVSTLTGLHVDPKSGFDTPDIQKRACLAMGRSVKGAGGVVLAILAARYCMPVYMRPALTPTRIHQHSTTLRTLATRQLKLWTVPEALLAEIAAEAKRLQVFHPQLLRAIVVEALANPAAAFPEGLRTGPSIVDAYALRPVWMDGSPHAANTDMGTAPPPPAVDPATGELTPTARFRARMRARIAENRRREAKGLPWLTENERAPGEPDPLPEADITPPPGDLDRIIDEQEHARDAELRAELEAEPPASPDVEGTTDAA